MDAPARHERTRQMALRLGTAAGPEVSPGATTARSPRPVVEPAQGPGRSFNPRLHVRQRNRRAPHTGRLGRLSVAVDSPGGPGLMVSSWSGGAATGDTPSMLGWRE